MLFGFSCWCDSVKQGAMMETTVVFWCQPQKYLMYSTHFTSTSLLCSQPLLHLNMRVSYQRIWDLLWHATLVPDNTKKEAVGPLNVHFLFHLGEIVSQLVPRCWTKMEPMNQNCASVSRSSVCYFVLWNACLLYCGIVYVVWCTKSSVIFVTCWWYIVFSAYFISTFTRNFPCYAQM